MAKTDKNAFFILIASSFFLLVYPLIKIGKYAFTQIGYAKVLSFGCGESPNYYGTMVYGCSINFTPSDFFLYSLILAIVAFLIKFDVISVDRLISYFKKLSSSDNGSQDAENNDKK